MAQSQPILEVYVPIYGTYIQVKGKLEPKLTNG
jgi:hypothetical protein